MSRTIEVHALCIVAMTAIVCSGRCCALRATMCGMLRSIKPRIVKRGSTPREAAIPPR